MAINHYFSLFICVMAISIGQLLFKQAAHYMNLHAQTPLLLGLITNLWLWAALLIQFLSALFWMWILRSVPLSQAYPFIALCFVVVPLLSFLFMHEQVSLSYMLGSGLIVAGIVATRW